MSLRLVNFTTDPSAEAFRAGFLSGEVVADLRRIAAACSEVKSPCDCSECWDSALGIAACEACLAAARDYAAWFAAQDAATQDALSTPRAGVKLLAPVPNPPKVFCLAQNFPSHVAEANQHITRAGISVADAMTPHVFMKPSGNTICGDGDPILITPDAQFVDYEGEVAVVIGKRGKAIGRDEALQYVAGVTCMNDVSERKLKLWERAEEREWDRFFDWLNGKWFDNFAPLGPCLVPTADLDVNNLDLKCYVNEELRQTGNTREMFHDVARTIEYISLMLTLEPGDVIAMGTPGGVGAGMNRKLVPGDVVRVEVEGVGVLSNPVAAE